MDTCKPLLADDNFTVVTPTEERFVTLTIYRYNNVYSDNFHCLWAWCDLKDISSRIKQFQSSLVGAHEDKISIILPIHKFITEQDKNT